MFSKYVAKGSPSRIKTDSATTETISLAFDNMAADEQIFDFAYEKCYQVLKFDYMVSGRVAKRRCSMNNFSFARKRASLVAIL